MKHELKIWPEHWQRVFEGTKTFEIRNNDRAFQKGDEVILKPFDPETNKYIEDSYYCDLHRKVGDVYPIDKKFVVFSLLKELK